MARKIIIALVATALLTLVPAIANAASFSLSGNTVAGQMSSNQNETEVSFQLNWQNTVGTTGSWFFGLDNWAVEDLVGGTITDANVLSGDASVTYSGSVNVDFWITPNIPPPPGPPTVQNLSQTPVQDTGQ